MIRNQLDPCKIHQALRFQARPAVALFLFLIAFLFPKPTFIGAEETSKSVSDQQVALKAERAKVASQIERLREPPENESREKQADSSALVEVLKARDAVLAKHESTLSELHAAILQLQEANAALESLKDYEPSEKKPYSFLTLEALRDELELQTLDAELLEVEWKSAKHRVQSDEEDLKDKQAAAKDLVLKKSDDPSSESLFSREAIELAKANLAYHQSQVQLLRLQQDLIKLAEKKLEIKIAAYEKGARYSVEDRETKVDQLKSQGNQLRANKRDADARMDRLLAMESTLRNSDLSDSIRTASLRLVHEAIEIYRSQSVLCDQVAESLSQAASIWKVRYEIDNAKESDLSKLREAKSNVDDLLEEVESYLNVLHHKRESIRRQVELDNAANAPIADEQANASYAEAMRFMDIASAQMANHLQSTQMSLSRFKKELKARITKSTSIWDMKPEEYLRSFFSYEIAEVDDKSISMSRAIYLVILIVLGIYASYLASKLIGKYVFPWLGIKPGVAVALRSIFRYLLCIVFGVVAFKLMGIPLTAFAFLGGAAAIAVGFGSQDVMNNFMGGLILLTEQPIRVGDVILLNDSQCTVTHIGLRSTRLRSYQGHELIVPNTLLIEKMVTNLTLSDNLLRVVVPLVVDRTEPIHESMQRIKDALKKEQRVHQAKEPIVLLKEVDTYYLTFEVHFTIEFADPMECLIAQSDTLAVIGKLFPTKTESPDDEESPSNTDIAQGGASLSRSAGKLSRVQLEREIKSLQAILVTKK